MNDQVINANKVRQMFQAMDEAQAKQCGKTFEPANGHIVWCQLKALHTGDHSGRILGSTC